MTTYSDDCLLCNELFNTNALSIQLGLCKNRDDMILFETESLILISDIRPVVPGHMLIVTKKHIPSFSWVQVNVWQELATIKKEAVDLLINHNNPPFFFEHGASTGSPLTSGCILHAHIHVIPYPINIIRYLIPISSNQPFITPIDMKTSLPDKKMDYLYYENYESHGCIVVNPKKPLPHQFIRMVVAKEAGIVDWDWRNIL